MLFRGWAVSRIWSSKGHRPGRRASLLVACLRGGQARSEAGSPALNAGHMPPLLDARAKDAASSNHAPWRPRLCGQSACATNGLKTFDVTIIRIAEQSLDQSG